MTLQNLAFQEDLLHDKVIEINNQPTTENTKELLANIFLDYKNIHQLYADLASQDIEALKRGLFIQWCVASEPNYLTGIDNVNENAADKIFQVVNELLNSKTF